MSSVKRNFMLLQEGFEIFFDALLRVKADGIVGRWFRLALPSGYALIFLSFVGPFAYDRLHTTLFPG